MTTTDSDLLLAFGRLEGKVDALIANGAAQAESLKLQDERMRQLETSRSALMGAVAIIATAISAAVAWATQ
jgi:type IV secretory pathway component VirB8